MSLLYIVQVNKFEGEKVALQRDISKSNAKLVDAKVTVCELEEECVSAALLPPPAISGINHSSCFVPLPNFSLVPIKNLFICCVLAGEVSKWLQHSSSDAALQTVQLCGSQTWYGVSMFYGM